MKKRISIILSVVLFTAALIFTIPRSFYIYDIEDIAKIKKSKMGKVTITHGKSGETIELDEEGKAYIFEKFKDLKFRLSWDQKPRFGNHLRLTIYDKSGKEISSISFTLNNRVVEDKAYIMNRAFSYDETTEIEKRFGFPVEEKEQ